MLPTQQIIDKAVKQVKTLYTKEVMPCTKINSKSFVVTVLNVRGGQQHVIDYTFTTNTARLTNTKIIESKWI